MYGYTFFVRDERKLIPKLFLVPLDICCSVNERVAKAHVPCKNMSSVFKKSFKLNELDKSLG